MGVGEPSSPTPDALRGPHRPGFPGKITAMKFLFVMDPLARIQIAGDTTFALMLEAQSREHEIFFCEPRHLGLEHDRAVAACWSVTARRIEGDHYLLVPQGSLALD